MASPSDVLALLRQHINQTISGEQLSLKLNISRSAIWKHMSQLKTAGYQIEAISNKGYRLLSIPDRLLPDEIQYQLTTKKIGKTIFAFNETTSTNDRAIEYAQAGKPEGSIIIAEHQTAGRGRRARTWLAEPNKNLLFSVILRPNWPVSMAARITPLMVVSVARAIEIMTKLTVDIKWPNDLFINQKKVAGILTEMQGQADAVDYIIAGIGINVNGSSPKHTRYPATSLATVHGQSINRLALLKEILKQIETYYLDLQKNGMVNIMKAWKQRSILNGTLVSINQGDQVTEGMVMGLDDQGGLMIRTEVGVIKTFASGEITSLKMAK